MHKTKPRLKPQGATEPRLTTDQIADLQKLALLCDARNFFAKYKNDGKYVHQELLRYLTNLFKEGDE